MTILQSKFNMIFNPNRPYHRTEIDQLFTKVKEQMHQQAVARGCDGLALYTDCYTGNTLRGGDPYDYEHIRSAEEVFMTYRGRLTNNQIAQVVNCPENVSVTLRSINQSKGKTPLEDWLTNLDNISKYNIDVMLAKRNLEKADKAIKKMVDKY